MGPTGEDRRTIEMGEEGEESMSGGKALPVAFMTSAKVHVCPLSHMRHQGYRGPKYKTLLTAGRYTVGIIPGKRTEIR